LLCSHLHCRMQGLDLPPESRVEVQVEFDILGAGWMAGLGQEEGSKLGPMNVDSGWEEQGGALSYACLHLHRWLVLHWKALYIKNELLTINSNRVQTHHHAVPLLFVHGQYYGALTRNVLVFHHLQKHFDYQTKRIPNLSPTYPYAWWFSLTHNTDGNLYRLPFHVYQVHCFQDIPLVCWGGKPSSRIVGDHKKLPCLSPEK